METRPLSLREARLTCEVRDSGIGIPEDRLGLLFRPFSQVDASTTREYGGTGLGLAICRRLAELMGGRIRVESVPGRGTRFWFEVVLRTAGELAARPPAATGARLGRELRVLVAEDNAVNRFVVLRMLETMGIRADAVFDGQQALLALHQATYDAVLLDLQMPVLDGLSAARRIRAEWPEPQRPRLIALTACALTGDRDRCLAAGMDDYLSKPLHIHELREALSLVPGAAEALLANQPALEAPQAADGRGAPDQRGGGR
jgi:CheY-like chemotaxis protein